MRLAARILYSLRTSRITARRATGAPAGAERGSWGPASEGVGGPRGRSPPGLDRLFRMSTRTNRPHDRTDRKFAIGEDRLLQRLARGTNWHCPCALSRQEVQHD